MSRRLTQESVLYWTVQAIVVICVVVAISLSLKSSLDSEKTYRRLRSSEDEFSQRPKVSVATKNNCRSPLVELKNGSCEPPCDWSFMTSSEIKIYDYIMSSCLRIALITAIITSLTWLAYKPLRKFPNIVRFYILLSSVSFTLAGILPSKLGKLETHCEENEHWTAAGIMSDRLTLQATVYQHSLCVAMATKNCYDICLFRVPLYLRSGLGAICHYLLLLLCFWLLCYVTNSYLLLVLDKHHVFTNPKKLHAAQFVLCTIAPFLFVAISLFREKPGYHMLFKDRMAILPSSYFIVFGAVTLPVLLSTGASLTMLLAIVKQVRKVSQNPRTAGQVIRSEEETATLKNVERHFLAIICLYALAMVLIFVAEVFLQDQEIAHLENVLEYFNCLHTKKPCREPGRPKFFLSNLKIITPGFFCFVTFFLLFFTNETRSVWRQWLQWAHSKMRYVGRFLLRWLGRCQASCSGKRRSLRITDHAAPVNVSSLRLGSIISLNVTQDVSLCETQAATLDELRNERPRGRTNDVVITHL